MRKTGTIRPGPSAATLTPGHSFTAADADAEVAVVDSGYATSNGLRAGSALTIDGIEFTVIRIVRPAGSSALGRRSDHARWLAPVRVRCARSA